MDSKMYEFPLTYKNHPLMRKDTILYYGSMADKYIVMMQVLDQEAKDDLKLSKRVKVELQLTDPDISSADRVVKESTKNGMFEALDLAAAWLQRALDGKI